MTHLATLPNGISKEQAKKAHEILTNAGIRAVARELNTNDTAIHNVLKGNSKNIDLLHNALVTAKSIIRREKQIQKQKIAKLPL